MKYFSFPTVSNVPNKHISVYQTEIHHLRQNDLLCNHQIKYWRKKINAPSQRIICCIYTALPKVIKCINLHFTIP